MSSRRWSAPHSCTCSSRPSILISTATAASAARDLFVLVDKDRARVLSASNASVMAARLLDLLPRHPMVTIPLAVKLLDTSKPAATKAIGVLEQLRILQEITGRRRDRTTLSRGVASGIETP
jgi:Fic family protein